MKTIETNHSLSVDCVILGFNGHELKVLLIESCESEPRRKLPGSMILENETLPAAAERVLADMTGLKGISLTQTTIYSEPDRVAKEDLVWINRNHGVDSHRVVTVGYYALIILNHSIIRNTSRKGASWSPIESVGELMMDHSAILSDTLEMIRTEATRTPILFSLLPRQFTLRSLQQLHCALLGIDLDKRNFRRKILNAELLIPTGRREVGVKHKPAEYFTFNHAEYKRRIKRGLKLTYL